MSKFIAPITALAAALSLAAAPAALAKTHTVGSAAGEASQNVCVADFACTYVNFKNGKPTDVVKRTGTIKSWSVRAASSGGTLRLRVLRPLGHGKYRFVRSSGLRTVGLDLNTYRTSLKVRKGDVLALTNTTSGLYFRTASSASEVRYFDYTSQQADGQSDRFARTAPALHLLLSAKVSS
jgi:hypothetical protein